jgi:Amiloride-sensitive sodium channel
MTAAALAGLLYNLQAVTGKYFSYPVNVGIEIRHASDLDFPAVTVCNLSPMRASLYDNYFQSSSSSGASRRRRRRAAGKSHLLMQCVGILLGLCFRNVLSS